MNKLQRPVPPVAFQPQAGRHHPQPAMPLQTKARTVLFPTVAPVAAPKRTGPLQRAPILQNANVVQRKDRSKDIKGLMDEVVDVDTIKANVASACLKVQQWAKAKGYSGGGIGRDAFFYSKHAWWNSTDRNKMLQNWTPKSAPASKTAAMLMDYALWWKNSDDAKNFRKEYAEEKNRKKSGQLLSPTEDETRTKGHKFESNSTYGRLATTSKYSTQAGASASTAQVLWMLRTIGGITQLESKSVAHALVWYWEGKDSIKAWHGSATGQKHTKFEVMIPLARHIGKF